MSKALVAALVAAMAVPAVRAQDRVVVVEDRDEDRAIIGERSAWPTELTRRPLVLDRGMAEVWFPLNINLTEDQEGEPFSSNPSLYFGVTDRWTLGVRHVVGICWQNDTDGCERFYNDVSVDSVFSLGRAAGLELAIGLAANVAPIDPDTWSGEARLVAKAGGGALALTVAPTFNFGINDRESLSKWAPTTFNVGTYNLVTTFHPTLENKEVVTLPATVQLQLGPSLAVVGAAALSGPINPEVGDFSDYYRIPVAAAVVLTPVRWIDLGASFTFPDLLGKNDTSDFRSLGIFAALRI